LTSPIAPRWVRPFPCGRDGRRDRRDHHDPWRNEDGLFDDHAEQYKPQDDSRLNDPANVAQAILLVLSQPAGCEIREMLICHEDEGSWP
jgi:hypothetical protein